MKRIIALSLFLATAACTAPAPAYAGECATAADITATAAEHGNKVVELTSEQFAILAAAFEKEGATIPPVIVKVLATPAIDDTDAITLVGVKADGCVFASISRSVKWFLDHVTGHTA